MRAAPKTWLDGGWRDLITPPWRRYEFTSRLASAEIVAVMQGVTRPRGGSRPQTSREFSGTITTDGFVVSRTIPYRNSFRPVIVGRLEWVPGGTRVRITMRLTWHLLAFWILWMTGVTVGAFTFLTQVQDVQRKLAPMLIILLGLPVFGYTIATTAFGQDARQAKHRLADLLSEVRRPPNEAVDPRVL